MASEQQLNELMDIAEQAMQEGDIATAKAARDQYLQLTAPPKPDPAPKFSASPAALVAGGADALATLVSGGLGQVAGGFAGLAHEYSNGPATGADTVERVSSALTHKPVTDNGKITIGALGKIGEFLHALGGGAGDAMYNATGSPTAAAVTSSLVEGAPALAGSGLAGDAAFASRGLQRVAPTAEGRLLQSEGVNLKRSQMGSEVAKSLDRGSDAVLGDSAFDRAQGADFNRAVMRRAGGNVRDDGRITPAEVRDLERDLSTTYRSLINRNVTQGDNVLFNELGQIERAANSEMRGEAGPIQGVIDDIRASVHDGGGVMRGQEAQALRERLGRLQGSANASQKHFAGQLKDMLDDAFERSAGPQDAAEMAQTRARWQMYYQIEQAMRGNASGYISPNKLYSVIDKPKGRGSELHDLAHAGKATLPDAVANSGTPTRAADVGKLLTLWKDPRELVKVLGSAFGGRLLNESPNIGARAAAVAGSPGSMAMAGASGMQTGQQMLEEQRRRTQAYLQAVGAL